MENSLKREFVLDTSALVSLGTVKLAEKVLKIAKITVTPSVVKELEAFAQFQDPYGKTSRKIA